MRRRAFWAGAGAALPAAFLAALGAGASSAALAAAAAGSALAPAALGWARADAASLWGACAACLVSTVLLLPALGAGPTLLAAAALAAWSVSEKPWPQTPTPPARRCAVAAAAAAAAALGFWRILTFLLGHSLYAASLTACAAAAGVAAGRRLHAWAAPGRAWLPGLGPLGAGLTGLGLLALLRVLGLNDYQAEMVKAPLRSWGHAAALCAQAGLGVALWAGWLAALEEDAPGAARPAALAAMAAPAVAAMALPLLGPAGCGASACLALTALGCWRGLARAREDRILARLVPCSALAAVALAWSSASGPRDIVQNRLNSVLPGGRFEVWREGGGQTLAVYRFDTGVPILLRDGVADFLAPDAAALEAHWPLMAHQARRVLLAGILQPQTFLAALAYGGEVEGIDAHPGCLEAASALARSPAPGSLRCGARPKGLYDAIIVDVPAPYWRPESALQATRESAGRWRAFLEPGGLLAWRLPSPPDSRASRRAAAALLARFKEVAQTPLADGTLLLASDRLENDIPELTLRARLPPGAMARLYKLLGSGSLPWSRVQPSPGEGPETAGRPLSALPARLRR